MTFLLAMTIGVATGAMRSILSIALVSMVLLVGAMGMVAIHGSLNVMEVLTALMGYQVGLINCLIVSITLSKRKAI